MNLSHGSLDRIVRHHLGVRKRSARRDSLNLSHGSLIIIIDNFCIALFSGVPKHNALYILQHFLSFTDIIHIIMTMIGSSVITWVSGSVVHVGCPTS